MPINPNIALGVQQQQPVNMLGQLGQIYALKGAKQEFEGNEALREAYAQGGDLNDPAFRQRVMAANPKLGSQLIKTSAETSKLQNEAVAKRIELSREMLTGINTPEDYLAWHESNHKDPVLGSYLSQRGVTAEDSRAKIMAELGKPGGLERLKRESALGAGKLQQELMQTERSVQVANIGAGPAYARLAFDKDRRNVIAMEGGYGQTDAYGNVYRVEGYGATRGPNALAAGPASSVGSGGGAPALSPAAANAFVTAKPSVNAFAPTAPVSQPGAPTVANAAAIEAQQNIPRPPARAGYKYDQVTGNLVKVPDEKPVWNDKAQVWMTPPTAENPQGKVVEAPAVQEAVQKRTANATLKVAGYNPTTKTDEVSELIKQSTSGLGENWANKVWSAISGTGSKGAEAIGQLETRANEMTLALAPNGSLGAGFSNEDRTFMLGKLGDVANPNKPMNVRLAAWEDVMERTARNAGVPYTKQPLGSSTKSSPKVIQFGELPK
jgi:hypothetical protein